jgi:hypothetical protein
MVLPFWEFQHTEKIYLKPKKNIRLMAGVVKCLLQELLKNLLTFPIDSQYLIRLLPFIVDNMKMQHKCETYK